MRILLIEDEKRLSENLAKGLRRLNYAVDISFDGEDGLFQYELNEYDLIVLDLNIPKIDGMTVLKEIRKRDRYIKVLILSAKNMPSDRINGLDSGANDYLVKPFDFGELAARIRNLLRMEFVVNDLILEHRDLIVDTRKKQAMIHNQIVKLTRKEYGILEYLLMNQDRVVSAEELTEHVWDSDYDPFSSTFRYHISSLRKKLNLLTDEEYICTVHGQGYALKENL